MQASMYIYIHVLYCIVNCEKKQVNVIMYVSERASQNYIMSGRMLLKKKCLWS